jgi:hypothetical protein
VEEQRSHALLQLVELLRREILDQLLEILRREAYPRGLRELGRLQARHAGGRQHGRVERSLLLAGRRLLARIRERAQQLLGIRVLGPQLALELPHLCVQVPAALRLRLRVRVPLLRRLRLLHRPANRGQHAAGATAHREGARGKARRAVCRPGAELAGRQLRQLLLMRGIVREDEHGPPVPRRLLREARAPALTEP